MPRFPSISGISTLFACALAAAGILHHAAAVAQDAPEPGPWQSLFDGKSLDGWEGDRNLWRIEDGVLTGETDGDARKVAANTFLVWTGGEPGDFELEFDARISGKNNSGVQYRSRRIDGEGWRIAGYQFDLHPNQPYLGMLYEEGGRGIICQRGQRVRVADKPEVLETFDIDEADAMAWNNFRLVVKGRELRHYVNGKLAAVIEDTHPEKAALKGLIALQLHAGPPMKAEFRNIRLREIKAAE